MEMFQRTFAMFTPFAKREAQAESERQQRAASGGGPSSGTEEIDDLKRQMEEMQKRLDRLGTKD
jgi:polyhydroxyalkanoate synthesis regulator protein